MFTNLVNTKDFVFDMIKELFDKILNELTGVKETNLYKLGFD
ncbi:MAG TPA: hypothetical protein PK993_06085 [Clostridia bacterium]|nr:hypothetical protein [Clostridia bacterium]